VSGHWRATAGLPHVSEILIEVHQLSAPACIVAGGKACPSVGVTHCGLRVDLCKFFVGSRHLGEGYKLQARGVKYRFGLLLCTTSKKRVVH
jgi:hypothetical protein